MEEGREGRRTREKGVRDEEKGGEQIGVRNEEEGA